MRRLLEPNARALDRPPGPPTCDAAPDSLILLHPELVVSATRDTKAVLDARSADAYILANRTCEMGLLHATGRPYQSLVLLLEERTRPERPSRSDEA
jgi:D-lactate dehydrogenase